MRKFLQLAAILIPLTVAAQTHAGIPLLPNVSVHTDAISLADLLPATAPESVIAAAKQIALGRSPSIGLQRTLERAEILRATPPNIVAQIEIPQSVTVTRWSRSLTPNEILAAIQKSFDANHISPTALLSSSDITIDSPVSVTESVPALNVVRFEPCTNKASTHVALWTVSEPHTPPFWVTIDREIDLTPTLPVAKKADADAAPDAREGDSVPRAPTETPLEIARTFPTTPTARAASASKQTQIRVGDLIELVVQGHGMRIATKATALESGAEGQRIRVKSATAEKVLVARIVGAETAEIDY